MTDVRRGDGGPPDTRSSLAGNTYDHRWELAEALARQSEAWRPLEATRANEAHNDALAEELDYVERHLHVVEGGPEL